MIDGSLTELLERQLEVAALSGEVQSVMEGIVERLMLLPGADGASLSTIDDTYAYFKVCAGADASLEGRTMLLTDTLGHACLDAGDLVVLRASEGPDVSRCLTPGAGAILLAPIEYDGRTRGILGVRSEDAQAFDDPAVDATRVLARSASIALRNAEVLERLASSEQKYRELHSQAADAMLVSDQSGRVLEANDAAAALFWHSASELAQMHVDELVFPGELERVPDRRGELAERRELRGERRFRRKDGVALDLEYSSRVLDDGRVHTTLRDVTQRKRNEHRLRSSLGRMQEILRTQQEISSLELDPAAVTAAIVERTQRLTGAEGAGVQWVEGEHTVYAHGSGLAAGNAGLRLPLAESLSGACLAAGEAIYCPDADVDPRANTAAGEQIAARSLICAPIGADGVLVVHASSPNAFDELAIETTRLMAEFVSSVVRKSTELELRRKLVDELRSYEQVVQYMQTALWIWILLPDGRFVLEHGNPASEAATGLPLAEILGKPLEAVLPALPDEVARELRQAVDDQRIVDWGEIEYGDERIRPSIFSMRALPLSGRRIAVGFENVTEIARSRRALQESESRFRGAFGSASVGMALTSLEGRFVQVNERLAEMLGYTTEELTRKTVREISHPEDMERDAIYVAEMLRGERTEWEHEKRYIRKDGTTVWGNSSVSLVHSYDGAPTHAVALIQDITKRREAESLFTAIFESSVVPKLIVDEERRVVDLNRGALELIGAPAEDVVGLALDDLLSNEQMERTWASFLDVGTMEAEATLHRPDGGTRQIEFVATAHVRPGRHIAVVRDLTRQKELESQLRQAQKMEAVGRLAGGIAHDFNNLLTAISGYSEFLASGIDDPRLKRHAEEIRKAAARAAALTGQLLAFSRRQVLQPRVLDLNAVVSDMDSLLRRLIGEDVELVTMLSPELASVKADPTQVEQVIVNLTVNARDAMPHGGAVTIETANIETEDGRFVELRLTDSGVGMSEEERHQLFDPFFTTKEGGTGLGLATVYGIVDQSGGTIEVDSAPGMGSSFRILLPAVLAIAEAPAPQATPEALPPGTETILLVEDETVVRQLVAEILETNGYTVLQAADGPSALELLRRHSDAIALLVTDVVMPGMSGPEVAKAVTAMRPGTQVLYTSGYTDSQIGHHGVLEPGIAFLQKPFSADDLTRKVRSLIDQPVAVD